MFYKYTVVVLKAKCKELGLPVYGRKRDLIEKLNKQNKPPQVEEEDSVGAAEEDEDQVQLHLSQSDNDDNLTKCCLECDQRRRSLE